MTIDEFMGYAPIEITFFLDRACNFNCDFCGYKETNCFSQMTVDTTIKLCHQLRYIFGKSPETKFYINFLGGEPTINMDLLKLCHAELDKIRKQFPDNLKFWITSNGWFGRDSFNIREIYNLNFDKVVLSCSIDHFNQGNAKYIKNILTSMYTLPIEFNMVDYNTVYKLYRTELLNICNDDLERAMVLNIYDRAKPFQSIDCRNIVENDALIEYFKTCDYTTTVQYKPFGIFFTNEALYTACAGNGAFPWCKIGENAFDFEKAVDTIKDMQMNVKQPCSKKKMLTCRHCQKYGYTCFGKKNLEVQVNNNTVEIKEV